jgi:hypothetical protein
MLKLAKPRYAAAVADNVDRAARYVDIDLMLTIVSAARESDASLSAKGTEMIETFRSGAWTFCGIRSHALGLPSSVTLPQPPSFEGCQPRRRIAGKRTSRARANSGRRSGVTHRRDEAVAPPHAPDEAARPFSPRLR